MTSTAAAWASAVAAFGALAVAIASVLINAGDRRDRKQLGERWQANGVAVWIGHRDGRLEVVARNTSPIPVWRLRITVGIGTSAIDIRELEVLAPADVADVIGFEAMPHWTSAAERLAKQPGQEDAVPWATMSFFDTEEVHWFRDRRGQLKRLTRVATNHRTSWTVHDSSGRTMYGWDPSRPATYWTWGDGRI